MIPKSDLQYQMTQWMDIMERLRVCQEGTYHYKEAQWEAKRAVRDMEGWIKSGKLVGLYND